MPWITRQQWSPNITKVTCKWPLHDTKIAPFWGMILEGVGCTWKHRIKYYSTVIMCILLYVILYDFVFFSSWQTQKVEFADWHVSLRSKVGFEWWVSGWRRHHGTLQPNAYCPDLSWIEGLASSELECKCIVQKKTEHILNMCAFQNQVNAKIYSAAKCNGASNVKKKSLRCISNLSSARRPLHAVQFTGFFGIVKLWACDITVEQL